MKQEFLKNIAFLLLVNVLIKPFFIFGIDRGVQNLVGEAEYGLYFSLMNFTFLFQIGCDLGMQNFNTRLIAQHRQLFQKVFGTMLGLKMGLAVGYWLVVMLLAWAVGYPLSWGKWIGFLALNQILTSLIFFLRSNLSAMGFYTSDSFLSVLDRLILIPLLGVLIWYPPFRSHFRVEWFIYAQSFSLLLTTCITFLLILKKLPLFQRDRKPFLGQSILRQSLPFAIIYFLMTIYARTDSVLLERLLPIDGKVQSGIYASAYRLLDAVNMFGYLFASLLLPMYANLLKDKTALQNLLKLGFQLIMVGSLTLATAAWFSRLDIMQLLYDHADMYSANIFGLLMWSFVAACGIYVYGTVLTANGNIRQMNILFMGAFFLNIILNILLIPTFKAIGATSVTLGGEFLIFGIEVWLVHRLLNLPFDTKMWQKILIFALFLLIIAYFWLCLLPTYWLWRFGLSIISGLVLSIFLKLIDVGEMQQLLKKVD